jgi:hypothetical protein
MLNKEVCNSSTRRKIATAVKETAIDVAKSFKNSNRVTRRKFIYGTGFLATETYFGLQIKDGINEVNQIAPKLDKQNPQLPDQVINEARRQVEVGQEFQKLTGKNIEQEMSKDAATRLRRAEDIIWKNNLYQQKSKELDKPLLKIVGNGFGAFFTAMGTAYAYIIHGVARGDL